jgi:hypothetical protein
MKKIMFMALGLLIASGATAFAQGTTKVVKDSVVSKSTNLPKDSVTTVISTTKDVKVKTEILSVELPQPVKDLGVSFKSQGWDTVEKAYVVKNTTADILYYVVTFKNPTSGESKSINIDAKGNIVKNEI